MELIPLPNDFVIPGYTIIGSCSICGGPVTVPTIWHCVIPPTPTCSRCGAIRADTHGSVIPMVPVKTTNTFVIKQNTHTGDTQ